MKGYSIYVFQTKNEKVAWFATLTDAQNYVDLIMSEYYDRTTIHTIVRVVDNRTSKTVYMDKNYEAEEC